MIINHVVGPSHVLRWRKQIVDGVLQSAVSVDAMYGHGGLPIWSKSLLTRVKGLGNNAKVGVIVGDFRFGNGICLTDVGGELIFQDGFLAIEKAALDDRYDRAMYQRCMTALQGWNILLKGRGRFVLWDLFCRQIQDRLAGRHIGKNGYRHPQWNLDEVMAALPALEMVDLRPLLALPMHEVSRLFIDNSSHPSLIGYLFLEMTLIHGLATMEAYQHAVQTVEQKLLHFAKRYLDDNKKKLILTGKSCWLDTLSQYMGANGQRRLAEAGLVIAPLNQLPGRLQLQDFRGQAVGAEIVILGDEAAATKVGLTINLDTEALTRLDWEAAIAEHIKSRRETPAFPLSSGEMGASTTALKSCVTEKMVELGVHGLPTFSGIMAVLDHVAGLNGTLADFHMENDILLTRDGVAYLAGGNHSVLKYASGELAPPAVSFKNFSENLAARKFHCESRGIPYLHVVFPDKQSVMEEDFPIKPVVKLGDVYRKKADAIVEDILVYPVSMLAGMQGESFYPLDTHLTDAGSLVVLETLLKRLDIVCDEIVAKIRQRICRPVFWSGDLGSKLAASPKQSGMLLEPDWRLEIFNSPGKSNDGSIDILISPDAMLDKTLLLFGDSFFRMMLKHFSAVFSRVICLRTRYFHPEMVELIRPDYVMTGNAERYLSFVSSDSNANAFFLYEKADAAEKDERFQEALRAVTSPQARESRAFFEQFIPSRDTDALQPVADNGIKGMRMLVATHHARQFGGSELVAMELADELCRRGASVDFYSPFMDKAFCRSNLSAEVQLLDSIGQIDLLNYDLCYSQHQVLSGALAAQAGNFAAASKKPVFVYGHLSPYEPMEFPGPWAEEMFADIILCNSNETLDKVKALGMSFQRAQLFQNPAPCSFARKIERTLLSIPEKILVVAQSLPEELDSALALLEEKGLHIKVIGQPGERKRVDVNILQAHDMVISMGKTIQYSLRAGVPVYCYGRFGGPGWLSMENFALAEQKNFSGRGFARKSSEDIFKEVMSFYGKGLGFVLGLSAGDLQRFSLEYVLDDLLAQFLHIRRDGSQRTAKNIITGVRSTLLRHEHFLYMLVDRHLK